MRLGARTVYLDMLADEEMVNIELDGDGVHSSWSDRERDLRRDSALAGLGLLVVRFTKRRLYHEADAVRAETLSILAARRSRRRRSA